MAGPRRPKALKHMGRDSPGWLSAQNPPSQRRQVLRRAQDLPKAGAAEGSEEMPSKVRVRYRNAGTGEGSRVQALPCKPLWKLKMFITLHLSQQKSPGKQSQSHHTAKPDLSRQGLTWDLFPPHPVAQKLYLNSALASQPFPTRAAGGLLSSHGHASAWLLTPPSRSQLTNRLPSVAHGPAWSPWTHPVIPRPDSDQTCFITTSFLDALDFVGPGSHLQDHPACLAEVLWDGFSWLSFKPWMCAAQRS